jgi:hypothetical protein
MSLDDPERLLAAGMQWAQRLGIDPIVVVPSRAVSVDAQTVIVAEDLLGSGDIVLEPLADVAGEPVSGAVVSDTVVSDARRMLVFPASLERLERAVAEGRLPSTASALVFEGGEWRRARSVTPHTLPGSSPAGRRPVITRLPWFDRHLNDVSRALREVPWARRLQPRFDRREDVVATALQHPDKFPFRMPYAIEGRVLLAIGTLGSGGAERQLVNTAEGLKSRGVDDVHVLVNYLYDDPSKAFYLERAKAAARSVHETPKDDYSSNAMGSVAAGLAQSPGRLVALIDSERCGGDPQVVAGGCARQPRLDEHHCRHGRGTGRRSACVSCRAGIFRRCTSRSFNGSCIPATARWPVVREFISSTTAMPGVWTTRRWLGLEPERISVLRNGLHTGDFPTG